MENSRLFNLIMLMRTSDVDLRLFAMNEMKKDSEEIEVLIKKHIGDEDVKAAAKELKTELASCESLTADERKEIVDTFKKALKTDMTSFPMDIIMKMYGSGDEFFVKKAKELIVESYGLYVRKIIHNYYPSYAVKYGEELFQCGCIGLLKAMSNYKTEYKFNTYCTNFVRHEISNQLNFHKNSSTVHFNNIQRRINQAIADIKSEGYEPSVEKISIMTDLKPEMVKRELDYIERTKFQYLDADEGNDRACEYEATPEAMFAQKERDESLHKAVMELPEEYRIIVIMRCDNHTNAEIAERLDISVGQVKVKYQKALQVLKRNHRLHETFSDYYSDAAVYMSHYSVDAFVPAKDIDEQMDELMECVGKINPSADSVYIVDASDPMGQLSFCL